jgi:hypothetical protein
VVIASNSGARGTKKETTRVELKVSNK